MEHPDHVHHEWDGENCPQCQQIALELFHDGEGLPIIHRHDIYHMIAMVVRRDDGVPEGMSNFIAVSLTGHRNESSGTGPSDLDPVTVNFAIDAEHAAEFAFAILETVGPILTK